MANVNDLVTALKNAVVEISGLAKAVKNSLPNISGGTSTTATGGAITPPTDVEAYLNVAVEGQPYTIPLYKP